jgi:hypothetical protein
MDCCPNILLKGFVSPPLAEKGVRRRLRIVYRKVVVVYRVKTKNETKLRNRYIAETQTGKRETDSSNSSWNSRSSLVRVTGIPPKEEKSPPGLDLDDNSRTNERVFQHVPQHAGVGLKKIGKLHQWTVT